MKLKVKIYLIEIFLIIVLLLFFGIFFYVYSNKAQKDINSNITNIVQTNRYFIKQMLSNIYERYALKKELFYKIHQYSLKRLKQNPNLDLNKLKQEIIERFNIKDIDINFFLINKKYIITKTTFPKDLGLNLSIFKDAKLYLDEATKTNKIYVASNISIDFLNSSLNVYSYSKLGNNKYLELGFKFKNSFYNQLEKSFEDIFKATGNKITLYRVFGLPTNYVSYDNFANKKNTNLTKEEYINTLKKFNINKNIDDPIINSIKYNKVYRETKNNHIIVYIPLLKASCSEHLTYYDMVIKIEVDITPYMSTIDETNNLFFTFFIIVTILLVILYFIVREQFYKPMMILTNTFEKESKITDKTLLNKTDEFGVLAKKYNKLYDSLSKEIEKNKTLLLENKRFIADTVHQIRTPLTNIMMNSDLIKMILKNKEVDEFIEQIEASINMLTNSYEDLSYVISHDTIKYTPRDVNLSVILKQRITFFYTIANVNHKKIKYSIEDNIFVYINQIELERIIDNNISNGIKYSTPNTDIFIKLEKKSNIVLEFITFGDKIKNPDKTFEKNYRENESKRGLGLGLSMVKNICEKYDIKYEVDYKEGKNIFRYIF